MLLLVCASILELSEPEIQKIVAERLEQVGLPGTQSSYPAECQAV
jgi:ABC-type transporter Mla maintaining outer membrane lipid asymmetry ATPase subunit MlaF